MFNSTYTDMPEKRKTYRIDENVLRGTLLGYSVTPDPSQCNAIEAEVANLRMQKTFKLPDTKILLKFVMAPFLLITTGLLLYFNMDAISNAFTPLEAPNKINTETKIATTPPVVNTQITAAVNNMPPPVVNNALVKHDTLVAATASAKKADTVKQQIAKQANPVLAEPPSDNVLPSTKKENILVKSSNVDSAALKNSDQPVKKKKKRRRRSDVYIEGVKESSLKPSAADDDVVVPQ